MSTNSKIEWTEATWNPVTGCTKVSAGCKYCYAERDWGRLSANPKTVYFGRKFSDVQCHPERLDQPVRWRKPRMIFVNSMSDLFHQDIPDEFIFKVLDVMVLDATWHTYQVLTKRPERMAKLIPSYLYSSRKQENPEWWLRNVWLGVSCEDQKAADERIPFLLSTPAAVRWVSAEPLLGGISLERWLPIAARGTGYEGVKVHSAYGDARPKLDWVVVGGESGPGARNFEAEWAEDIISQCVLAGISVFMKQVGSNPAITDFVRRRNRIITKRGKLKDRKGGDPAEWPAYLRVREYPKAKP